MTLISSTDISPLIVYSHPVRFPLQSILIKIIVYNNPMRVQTITHRVLSLFSTSSPHFTLLSSTPAPDLKATLLQYSHNSTKARIYHYLNTDPQSAFASIVKTYVSNDSGCPHILEHLSCCGSQKYPVRDPFFNMLRRSVNTYMNAWTGDDFTSYLFSSANPTDWNNLYRVYLDMTLKAGLHELDFRQEGWRWELNEQGRREFKGIVLNEMKGAYQDADRQMMREINQELFRGTPYVYDSGGRPADIVNLEYSQLKKMYEYYYHPSNIAFYYYGSQDITPSLEYLHQEYLSQYRDESHRYDNVSLNPQPIVNKHKTIVSQTAQSNSISINLLLGKIQSIPPLEAMCLRVLHYLLLEKSNAKFYQRFIQSGIAQNIGFSGFNQSKMATFTLTLKGIYPQYSCEQFQHEFSDVLKEIIQKGVEKDRLQEFAHQFQVNLLTPRENNGIRVLQECMGLLNHRLNMDLFLNPRPYLNEAILKLQDPSFLSSLITRLFLNNDRIVVVRQLLAEVQSKEEPLVSKVVMEDTVVAKQQEELKKRQAEKVDPSILPMLKMQDIITPKRLQPILVGVQSTGTKKYEQYHVKIQEDINFYRLVFSFPSVDSEFLSALTLWEAAINRIISTHSHSYNELTGLLANHTAGFNVFHSVGNGDELQVAFEFSSLKKNTMTAFQLLGEIILGPKFQKEHTLNAFKAFNNEATEGLVENPMNQCLNQAASQLHRTGALLNSYQRIKESLDIIQEQRVESLYQLSLRLGQCTSLKLIEHSNQKSILPPKLISTLLRSSGQLMSPFSFSPILTPKAVVHGYMVNFCGQQYIAPPYLSPEHARVSLLLVLLQQDYLHPLIREKGGAYGSGARVRNNGTLSLSSYLDPNSVQTFAVFDQSVQQLLSRDTIEDLTLLQAKIKQFGEVDRVKIPQNEGVSQILRGYTKEDYDNFREALRTASFKDIVQTGRKYLGPNAVKSRCLFGKTAPEGFVQEKLKDFLL